MILNVCLVQPIEKGEVENKWQWHVDTHIVHLSIGFLLCKCYVLNGIMDMINDPSPLHTIMTCKHLVHICVVYIYSQVNNTSPHHWILFLNKYAFKIGHVWHVIFKRSLILTTTTSTRVLVNSHASLKEICNYKCDRFVKFSLT